VFISDFQSNSNTRFFPLKDQSISVFINQEFFAFRRIDHAFLPPSVSKQSITSFPQSSGANESPPAELTMFSARVNVTPFSIIINGHRVDKGSRIWVESTHLSKRHINRGFSLVVEFKFDFINPSLSIGGFSVGVSPAGQSNQIGSHQGFFLQHDIIQSTDISDRNSCTSTSTSSFSKGGMLGMDHPQDHSRGSPAEIATVIRGMWRNPTAKIHIYIYMLVSTHSSVLNLHNSSAYRSAPNQTPTELINASVRLFT